MKGKNMNEAPIDVLLGGEIGLWNTLSEIEKEEVIKRIAEQPEDCSRHLIWQVSPCIVMDPKMRNLFKINLADWSETDFTSVPILSSDMQICGLGPYKLCHRVDWRHGAVQVAFLTSDSSEVLVQLRYNESLDLTATGHVTSEDFLEWSLQELPDTKDVRNCPFEKAARIAARREIDEEVLNNRDMKIKELESKLELKGVYWWRPSRLSKTIPESRVKPNHEARAVFTWRIEDEEMKTSLGEQWSRELDTESVRQEAQYKLSRYVRGEVLGLYWVDVDKLCQKLFGSRRALEGLKPPDHVKGIKNIEAWDFTASGLLVSFPFVLQGQPI